MCAPRSLKVLAVLAIVSAWVACAVDEAQTNPALQSADRNDGAAQRANPDAIPAPPPREEPISVEEYLAEMGEKLDCFFTIEDDLDPEGALPWIRYIDIVPDGDIDTIDALVEWLDERLEGVIAARSLKHPRVVHLIAESLVEDGYVMDEQVDTVFSGCISMLPYHLGTILNWRINQPSGRPMPGIFGDFETGVAVDAKQETVRDVLTDAVPFDYYCRFPWEANREYGTMGDPIVVVFFGPRGEPEDYDEDEEEEEAEEEEGFTEDDGERESTRDEETARRRERDRDPFGDAGDLPDAPQPQRETFEAVEAARPDAKVELGEADAVRVARDSLGLRHDEGFHADAGRVMLTKESVPFLAPQLEGRETWRVEFRDLDLEKATGNPRLRNPHITRLAVLLAPQSGQVIQVSSAWPEGVRPMATYPSRGEEERQLKAASVTYTGFPARAAKVTLFDAVANRDMMFWSSEVKQIHAHFVLQSTIRYEDRAVWCIQLRGFPPFEPPGPRGADVKDISEEARNHFRNVVDAMSGQWLHADTIPQPTRTEPSAKKLPPLQQRF
jgi:hypothetical protein